MINMSSFGNKLKSYINGNYYVHLFEDGTKVRECYDNEFHPKFPETIDINISDHCLNNCAYCYIDANRDKSHGNFDYIRQLKIPPGVELALNLNSHIPPGFDELLTELRDQKNIVNITISSLNLRKFYSTLTEWQTDGKVNGIGISLCSPLHDHSELKNVVYHIVNGLHTVENLLTKLPSSSKILVLGYKNMKGRGITYAPKHFLSNNDVSKLLDYFEVVSFDNLALDQLAVKDIVDPVIWEQNYMGDDGLFSMYIDTVDGTFARSSTSDEKFPIEAFSTITSVFKQIKEKSC